MSFGVASSCVALCCVLLCRFRFCACGGFVYFIRAFGVGFGRLAVAVVSCGCLAGSVRHTATALLNRLCFK